MNTYEAFITLTVKAKTQKDADGLVKKLVNVLKTGFPDTKVIYNDIQQVKE